MSRLNDAELQAESLNRGVEELYYGEEWPSDLELLMDSQRREEKDERPNQH